MTVPKYMPHYLVQDYQQWEGDWELWNDKPIGEMQSGECGLHLAEHKSRLFDPASGKLAGNDRKRSL